MAREPTCCATGGCKAGLPATAYCAIVAVACLAGCIAVCEIDAAIGERSGLCWLRDHL